MSDTALDTTVEAEEVNYDNYSDADFNLLDTPEDIPTAANEAEESTVEDDTAVLEATDTDEVQEVEASEATEEPSQDAEEEGTEEAKPKVNSLEELLKTPLMRGDTEITVNSAEELVVLAQRGLEAGKRIQDLAPDLKIVSTLKANGITDPKELNFLIALHKKDPAAIQKLVASSGMDPFDVSTDADEEYVAQDYAVPESQLAVESAFADISNTASYDDTLKTINDFDNASKAEIRKDPSMIGQLSAHHENGYYQEIKGIVAKEQAMGNLPGLSDFAAYKHVWSKIQEHSASTAGKPEAGHENLTNDQSSGEYLAGTEGTQEAGHNTSIGTQVGEAQAKARKAADSTNKNRGEPKAQTVNIDDLTDDQIKNMDVSDLFK